MQCRRCGGMMDQIYVPDFHNETAQPFIEAWHCINCGEIVDWTILHNRGERPLPFHQKARLKKSVRVGNWKM